jgi:microcystin-dependent protein
MKKIFTLFFVVFALVFTASAQNKGFSFQGYARDAEGAALSGQEVKVKFSIFINGSESSPDFSEQHTVNTDAYGVFSAVVGSVSTTDFNNLIFHEKDYWLKVEVETGSGGMVEINKTELLSVPYANAAEKANSAANGVPPGTILPFAGPVANIPDGYLACDGSEHNISNYPSLFAAIATSWGGNGSSTFRVPDLRGQFLRGLDQGSGNDPNAGGRTAKNGGNSGDNVGSFQGDEVKSHNHTMNSAGAHTHNHDDYYFSENHAGGGGELGSNGSDWDNRLHQKSGRTTSSAGAHTHTINNTGGNETRPKNAAVFYIIKY